MEIFENNDKFLKDILEFSHIAVYKIRNLCYTSKV